MPKFVIEVSNVKRRGPAFVYPGRLMPDPAGGPARVEVSALGVLVLDPSENQDTSVRLTSAQFLNYSYEIEGKTHGKYGCDRDLKLHAVDVESGEKLELSYAEALDIVVQGINDDAAAEADQKKQADELAKAALDLEEDEEDESAGS